MYKIGDLVIYGSYGVCKVEAVGTPDISGIDKSKLYYTFRHLYHNEKIYTPTDTIVFMRPVIKYEEVQQLIYSIPSIKESKYSNCGIKILEDYYKNLIKTHDCYDLLKLIKSIYIKERMIASKGKKLGQIDTRFMHKAEELLYEEFAVALEIPKENVKSYIEEKVKEFENIDVINSGGQVYEYGEQTNKIRNIWGWKSN